MKESPFTYGCAASQRVIQKGAGAKSIQTGSSLLKNRRAWYSMINPMLCWEKQITHTINVRAGFCFSQKLSQLLLIKTFSISLTHRPECGRTTRRT